MFDLHKGDTAAPDSLRPFDDTNVGFDISIKGNYNDLKFYVARDTGTNNWLGCNGITSEKHAIAWLKWGLSCCLLAGCGAFLDERLSSTEPTWPRTVKRL